LKLLCTKFNFDWNFVPTHSFSRSSGWILRVLLPRRKRKEKEEKKKWKEVVKREKKEEKRVRTKWERKQEENCRREARTPQVHISVYAIGLCHNYAHQPCSNIVQPKRSLLTDNF